MTRIWVLTLILGLVPAVALAQGAPDSSCEVTTELAPGAELDTIHNNVLCLNQRLDVIRQELKSQSDDEFERSGEAPSGSLRNYVVLQPDDEEGGSVNPCDRDGSYNAMLCYARILRTFGVFCTTGNCAEGFEPWRDFMPNNWNQYLKKKKIYTFAPGPWAEEILKKEDWFRLDQREGQMFDMQKLFRNMEPDQVLTPMHMPQFHGTGQ